MPAQYTVVQFVPDPVRGEKINIGIVGYADGRLLTRFLTHWERVRAFAGASAIRPETLEKIFRGVDEGGLIEMILTWQNSIQFTTPGCSLKSLEETVDEAAERFLVDRPEGNDT